MENSPITKYVFSLNKIRIIVCVFSKNLDMTF